MNSKWFHPYHNIIKSLSTSNGLRYAEHAIAIFPCSSAAWEVYADACLAANRPEAAAKSLEKLTTLLKEEDEKEELQAAENNIEDSQKETEQELPEWGLYAISLFTNKINKFINRITIALKRSCAALRLFMFDEALQICEGWKEKATDLLEQANKLRMKINNILAEKHGKTEKDFAAITKFPEIIEKRLSLIKMFTFLSLFFKGYSSFYYRERP